MPHALRLLMTVDSSEDIWRYALDLGRTFSRRGVAITLLGFGPEPDATQRAAVAAIEGVTLMWREQLPSARTAPDAEALAPLAAEIARIAREETSDIVHLNAPAEAVGLRLDRPVIVSAHACFATEWRATREGPLPDDERWRLKLDRIGLGAADQVLVPSESFGEALTHIHGSLPRMRVALRGAEAGAAPEERRDVVVVEGRWWGKDGEKLAILDAAAKIAEWPVEVIGGFESPDGQKAPETQNVVRLDQLSPEEQGSRRAGARVFLSISPYEPFGIQALDAALSGSALILSDIPAHREVWEGAAVYVDPRDADMIGRTINRLARQMLLRDILTDAAGLRAKRFSLDAQGVSVLRTYAEAVVTRSREGAAATAQQRAS